MFAFAGNLVSGVTNAVYSTIFGADTEPEATTELEPTQHPELTEPNTEQNIPPIEKLQININTPSQEKINSTPQPSRESRESYVPIIQPSPRNNTDATKNFDLRTKNLHAALTSPSTFNYNTPQKSAFKRTDSPSRGISSQVRPIQ